MNPLKRSLLKAILLEMPDRPETIELGRLKKKIDYRKFSDEEVSDAMEELADEGYFRKVDMEYRGDYEFLRDGFLRARRKFNWYIWLHSEKVRSTLVPLVAMGVAAIFATIPVGLLAGFGEKDKNPRDTVAQSKIAEVSSRLDRIESSFEARQLGSVSSEIGPDLEAIRGRLEEAETLSKSLTRLLTEDPSTVLDLAAVRADLDRLSESQERELASLHRELDRVSSYNTTIILFMVTFMIAFFGLGLFNLFKNKPD